MTMFEVHVLGSSDLKRETSKQQRKIQAKTGEKPSHDEKTEKDVLQ